MTELLFPVVGAAIVFFVAIPLLTLLALLATKLSPRSRDALSEQANPWRYALVVGPTIAPVLWFVSAAVHQVEEGFPLATCVLEHLGDDICADVFLFAGVLLAVLGVGVFRKLRDERSTGATASTNRSAVRRVARICEHVDLAAYADRIRVVSRGEALVCTRGLLRPQVEIEASLLEELDDAEVTATLLHEIEHLRARDPLHFFVAHVALSLNPLGRLMGAEFARYRFAREALCDRSAVERGAEPLALARSIVRVASPQRARVCAAHLGGTGGIQGIRVRVQLLLRYPGVAVERRRRRPLGILAIAVVLLIVWPHIAGTQPLDLLHHGVERTGLALGMD